ncbi:MAG TPA: MBL fold metallo-hydrolase [Candidatus Binatia bacterium]|jgi:glyoxylase-like metal-dependent hydrolase (beta-lactamase superfamily II)/rhodanese-related sulfurtransferase
MIFRQLFDPVSSTYTYLLGDERTREALLIDPVFEKFERERALLEELGLKLLYTLETHVHADHVTAAWRFREALGSKIVISRRSEAEGADIYVDDGDPIRFSGVELRVVATPGHTDGCVTYVTGDWRMAFTGDALLIRSAGRTDFQHGDAHALYHSIRDKIFSLPEDCLLYPGHDYGGRTVTSVGEEKRWNPRIGGDASESDFVGYMQNLGLPHPKQLDIAVPANRRCGKPETAISTDRPTWGPVHRTFAGVSEIEPVWVHEHPSLVTMLDVREPAELTGELGRIEGSMHIPLGELRKRVDEVPRDKPVVCICRSGRRSAQAVAILEQASVPDVANVTGGMIRWRSQHL